MFRCRDSPYRYKQAPSWPRLPLPSSPGFLPQQHSSPRFRCF
jgi:hypothetical protein